MLKKLKKVCICGHFGNGENLLNGQTIKTKIVANELKKQFGDDEVCTLDTHGGISSLPEIIIASVRLFKNCRNVIILPAQNGLRIFAPLYVLLNHIFHRNLIYIVIGGWLDEYLKTHTLVKCSLKKYNGIYVETRGMKVALEQSGLANISVMPNCKQLDIIPEDQLVYPENEPYHLCTFSRVMKEKGIEDAINAVKAVNEHYGRAVFTLDIYGQVDAGYQERFAVLQKEFPPFVQYRGCIDYDNSAQVLKEYAALLFPTYYEGEGFAGTIIDAMAAGIAIIASDWKYNPEVVKPQVGFLFRSGSVEALTNQLEYLAVHPQELSQRKAACIMRAQRYTAVYVVGEFAKDLT